MRVPKWASEEVGTVRLAEAIHWIVPSGRKPHIIVDDSRLDHHHRLTCASFWIHLALAAELRVLLERVVEARLVPPVPPPESER